MPGSLGNRDDRAAIQARLARLTPTSPRRWGRMAPEQLLPHLGDGLRMALGQVERPARGKRGAIGTAMFRWLAIYLLPWPEGKIEAPPGSFARPSEGWEADRDTLRDLIERLGAAGPGDIGATHPDFGRMSLRDWQVLQYRHLDHHLRQFSA